MDSSPDRRPVLWLIFLASSAVAIALFLIPAFIIYPFRHQTERGLALAMALSQRAPWATIPPALLCLFLMFLLWQVSNRWRKIVLCAVMVLVAFSTVMARINYFEWMFHPIQSSQFDSEAASKLDKGEMILAVRYGNDARAYPIREMAYHHILNDVVEGVPIAVTY
jgi:hypothetical protein